MTGAAVLARWRHRVAGRRARSAEYLPVARSPPGGTPNIAGVVAMARSLQFLQSIGIDRGPRARGKLTRRMLDGTAAPVGGITVYGPPRRREAAGRGVVQRRRRVRAARRRRAVRGGRHRGALRAVLRAHLHVDRLLASTPRIEARARRRAPTGAVRAAWACTTTSRRRAHARVRRARSATRKWIGRYRVKGETMSRRVRRPVRRSLDGGHARGRAAPRSARRSARRAATTSRSCSPTAAAAAT